MRRLSMYIILRRQCQCRCGSEPTHLVRLLWSLLLRHLCRHNSMLTKMGCNDGWVCLLSASERQCIIGTVQFRIINQCARCSRDGLFFCRRKVRVCACVCMFGIEVSLVHEYFHLPSTLIMIIHAIAGRILFSKFVDLIRLKQMKA